MADYDSDSSADSSGDIRTQVLLGYASAIPTSDDFSQIGGHPAFLDPNNKPSAELVKCKICNKYMSLILQLNADLPEQFPGHERRLYLWVCRSKTCRRKEGSVRGFRGIRVAAGLERKVAEPAVVEEEQKKEADKPKSRVGEALFGVKASSNGAGNANPFGGNPFSSGGSAAGNANPFASASSLAAKPAQKPIQEPQAEKKDEAALPETFAQKARLSSPQPTSNTTTASPEPWPKESAFPKPYPSQHLDAGAEYIDPTPTPAAPSNVRVDTEDGGMGVKDAFESSMDKTFQKFADRLSQNPEQVLRYEYAGTPLLYSKTDVVGQRFSDSKVGVKGIPRCGCGANRVFELQVTPQLIMELERDDLGLDGMDWGTILFGSCERDCGGMGFSEEWVGVQWEESASHKRPT